MILKKIKEWRTVKYKKDWYVINKGDPYFFFIADRHGGGMIQHKDGGYGLSFSSFSKFVKMVNDFDKVRRDHFMDKYCEEWIDEEIDQTEWFNVDELVDVYEFKISWWRVLWRKWTRPKK